MTTPAIRHLPPDIHRTAVNGSDVRYLRAGSGTPVVFVHTLRTQLEMFLQVIEQLNTTHVEVIAIDLPGHGESAAPPVEYTAGYLTDAAEGPLAHLDLHQAALAGEPIGASISLILAARGNPRIAHVGRSTPMTTAAGAARAGPHFLREDVGGRLAEAFKASRSEAG